MPNQNSVRLLLCGKHFLLRGLALIALLLAGCGAGASTMTTPTSTIEPTAEPTTAFTGIQGNWEGTSPLHTTFVVTADGKLRHFQSRGSVGPSSYSVQVNDDIVIKPDRSFAYSGTTPEGNIVVAGKFANDDEVSGQIAFGQGQVTVYFWSAQHVAPIAGRGATEMATVAAKTSGFAGVLSGHDSTVWGVAWSPDGKTLASSSQDSTLRLWDVATDQSSQYIQMPGGPCIVFSVAWSPDGKTLASASSDGTVRLWDVASRQLLTVLQGHTIEAHGVAWSPDGKMLAFGGGGDKPVELWDVTSGQLVRTLPVNSWVDSVAWSPDGKKLASGGGDKPVELWDVTSGQLVRTLQGHESVVYDVAWSPDGKMLASAGRDKTVRLWDVASGQLLRTFQGHTDEVMSVAWSPDGKALASASYDTTVRLWDVASGQLLHTLQGHTDKVMSVAWSPDGRTLASGSWDDSVRLWDVSSLH